MIPLTLSIGSGGFRAEYGTPSSSTFLATDPASLSEVADETAGDTIYRIDRVSEVALLDLFESELSNAV